MPKVNGQKFAYTPAGKAAADKARKKNSVKKKLKNTSLKIKG